MKAMDILKEFFKADGGKPLSNQELLEFKKAGGDIRELATLAAAGMGVTLDPAVKA